MICVFIVETRPLDIQVSQRHRAEERTHQPVLRTQIGSMEGQSERRKPPVDDNGNDTPNSPSLTPSSLKRSIESSGSSGSKNNGKTKINARTSSGSAFMRPLSMPDASKTRKRAAHPGSSSSVYLLLRERQKIGQAGRFVTREGAGVWSPDPLQRAVGSSPDILRRMQLSGELKGHRGCVNTVSCTPDGRYWITGSDDMKLMVGVLSRVIWVGLMKVCLIITTDS